MQSQHLNAEFLSVFPHLSVPRKSLQFTYTYLGGGMSTPSSHFPQHSCSGFTDPPYCTNTNSFSACFWKVPGWSFERKIKVFCLIYSALGISPSRQYGWGCTRLSFCSAESSNNSLWALQTQKLQTCHVIHARTKCIISASFHEHTKHQDCSTAQNLNWEGTQNDSYVLEEERPEEGHKAKCSKERTELTCC